MLMSRHRLTDSRLYAHTLRSKCPVIYWPFAAKRLTWGGKSPEAECQTASRDLAVCAYGCREVAL